MNNTKEKNSKGMYVAFALNLLIVIMEIIATSRSISRNGIGFCRFYTEDSNLLALITSLIFCILFIITIKKSNYVIPKWILTLRYITTSCLSVTFLVVVFVLVPMGMGSYETMLFKDSMLVHHFLAPVISFISLVVFESHGRLNFTDNLWVLLPTIVYAIIATILNIARIMVGPYPFLMVYNQPVIMSVVWFVVILGGNFLIALGIRILANFISKKIKN